MKVSNLKHYLWGCFALCFSNLLISQSCTVSTSDSTALINFHNALDGTNWITKWDLNMPISTWHGITLDQCKITDIRISNNNLSGVIPNINLPDVSFVIIDDQAISGALPDFSNAPNLLIFEAIGNNISDIPNLTGHPSLAKVLISDNNLTFEDILPNEALMQQDAPFPGYSMQKKLASPAGATLQLGDNHTITIPSFDQGITSNVYEWFLGNTSLGVGNGQSFILTNVSLADAGDYTLKVTNPNAPDLTLFSEIITITISGTGICDQDDLSIDTIAQNFYHARQTITSTATIFSSIIFKAGASITLQPNFQVLNGESFIATIEACPPANFEETPPNTFSAITSESDDGTTSTNALQVYPNPFNYQTTIDYDLIHTGLVQIALYDLSGKQIQVLENAVKEKGKHQIILDEGQLGNGIYFLRAILGESVQTQKVYLVK